MNNALELPVAVAVPLSLGGLSGTAICATVLLFWRVVPGAGWLLLPHWAWVGFAAVLNGSIWILDR